MTQYTDVLINFTVNGVDMTTVSQPHITFTQDNMVLDVTDISITDAQNFSLILNQAQTGRFKVGNVKVQLNYINNVGKREASDIAEISATSNLLKRILSNGG